MGYLGLSIRCILIKIGEGIWMKYAVLEAVRCFLELSPFSIHWKLRSRTLKTVARFFV